MTTPENTNLVPTAEASLDPMGMPAPLRPAVQDAAAELRARIMAEEKAKIEEELLRAQVRAQLQTEMGTPMAPAPVVPVAPAMTPQVVHYGEAPGMPGAAAVQQPTIVVNVTNANTNTNTNTIGMAVKAGRTHPPTWVRILYFVFFGCWVGPLWVCGALIMLCTVIGIPVGVLMLRYTVESFFL